MRWCGLGVVVLALAGCSGTDVLNAMTPAFDFDPDFDGETEQVH